MSDDTSECSGCIYLSAALELREFGMGLAKELGEGDGPVHVTIQRQSAEALGVALGMAVVALETGSVVIHKADHAVETLVTPFRPPEGGQPTVDT